MDEISYSGSGGSTPSKKRISKRTALFGLVALIVIALIGGVIFFATRSGGSNSEDQNQTIELPTTEPTQSLDSPTPEPGTSTTPTKAPTKTPTKAPTGVSNDNSSTSITVQNGSGEVGAGAKAADALKAAGFTIASTGNADNFDYTDVTIQIKASEKSALSGIESALKSAGYTIGDTSSDLSEGQSYDALVIVGK